MVQTYIKDLNKNEAGKLEPKPGCSTSKSAKSSVPKIPAIAVCNKENEYRKKNKEALLPKLVDRLKCTKCLKDLKNLYYEGQLIPLHPTLQVLFCEECLEFYGDGDFSGDEDGDDKYCRWCGEGGELFICSQCGCGFCPACIKKHFGNKERARVKASEVWNCYLCNSEPFWELRHIAALANTGSMEKIVSQTNETNVPTESTPEEGNDTSPTDGASMFRELALKISPALDLLSALRKACYVCFIEIGSVLETAKNIEDEDSYETFHETVKTLDVELVSMENVIQKLRSCTSTNSTAQQGSAQAIFLEDGSSMESTGLQSTPARSLDDIFNAATIRKDAFNINTEESSNGDVCDNALIDDDDLSDDKNSSSRNCNVKESEQEIANAKKPKSKSEGKLKIIKTVINDYDSPTKDDNADNGGSKESNVNVDLVDRLNDCLADSVSGTPAKAETKKKSKFSEEYNGFLRRAILTSQSDESDSKNQSGEESNFEPEHIKSREVIIAQNSSTKPVKVNSRTLLSRRGVFDSDSSSSNNEDVTEMIREKRNVALKKMMSDNENNSIDSPKIKTARKSLLQSFRSPSSAMRMSGKKSTVSISDSWEVENVEATVAQPVNQGLQSCENSSTYYLTPVKSKSPQKKNTPEVTKPTRSTALIRKESGTVVGGSSSDDTDSLLEKIEGRKCESNGRKFVKRSTIVSKIVLTSNGEGKIRDPTDSSDDSSSEDEVKIVKKFTKRRVISDSSSEEMAVARKSPLRKRKNGRRLLTPGSKQGDSASEKFGSESDTLANVPSTSHSDANDVGSLNPVITKERKTFNPKASSSDGQDVSSSIRKDSASKLSQVDSESDSSDADSDKNVKSRKPANKEAERFISKVTSDRKVRKHSTSSSKRKNSASEGSKIDSESESEYETASSSDSDSENNAESRKPAAQKARSSIGKPTSSSSAASNDSNSSSNSDSEPPSRRLSVKGGKEATKLQNSKISKVSKRRVSNSDENTSRASSDSEFENMKSPAKGRKNLQAKHKVAISRTSRCSEPFVKSPSTKLSNIQNLQGSERRNDDSEHSDSEPNEPPAKTLRAMNSNDGFFKKSVISQSNSNCLDDETFRKSPLTKNRKSLGQMLSAKSSNRSSKQSGRKNSDSDSGDVNSSLTTTSKGNEEVSRAKECKSLVQKLHARSSKNNSNGSKQSSSKSSDSDSFLTPNTSKSKEEVSCEFKECKIVLQKLQAKSSKSISGGSKQEQNSDSDSGSSPSSPANDKPFCTSSSKARDSTLKQSQRYKTGIEFDLKVPPTSTNKSPNNGNKSVDMFPIIVLKDILKQPIANRYISLLDVANTNKSGNNEKHHNNYNDNDVTSTSSIDSDSDSEDNNATTKRHNNADKLHVKSSVKSNVGGLDSEDNEPPNKKTKKSLWRSIRDINKNSVQSVDGSDLTSEDNEIPTKKTKQLRSSTLKNNDVHSKSRPERFSKSKANSRSSSSNDSDNSSASSTDGSDSEDFELRRKKSKRQIAKSNRGSMSKSHVHKRFKKSTDATNDDSGSDVEVVFGNSPRRFSKRQKDSPGFSEMSVQEEMSKKVSEKTTKNRRRKNSARS